MKIFTHSYTVILYEDGKFCWKNKGWIEDKDISLGEVMFCGLLIYMIIAGIG